MGLALSVSSGNNITSNHFFIELMHKFQERCSGILQDSEVKLDLCTSRCTKRWI